MSTLKVSQLQDLSGNVLTPARAWVNFNGTGTVAIRASSNVSSITDNGTGDYTVNFTAAMPDANYSVVAMTRSNVEPASGVGGFCALVSLTTAVAAGSVRIFTANVTANANASSIVGVIDHSQVNVAVFR